MLPSLETPERSESGTARVLGEAAENGCDFDGAACPRTAPEGGADYQQENDSTGRYRE